MTESSVQTSARTELTAERDRLTGQIAALDPGSAESGFDDNFADSGQVAAEQGENKVLAGQLRTELDDVETALAKLDDGTYGTCEACGNAISGARLEAMPQARFCIDHA